MVTGEAREIRRPYAMEEAPRQREKAAARQWVSRQAPIIANHGSLLPYEIG
jgi:hypothetical protein